MAEEEILLQGEKDLISDLSDSLDIDTRDIGEITDAISKINIEKLAQIIFLKETALRHVNNLQKKLAGAFGIDDIAEIKSFRYQLDLASDMVIIICEQKEKISGGHEERIINPSEDDDVLSFTVRSELQISDDDEIMDAIHNLKADQIQKIVRVKILSLDHVKKLQNELDKAFVIGDTLEIRNIREQLKGALDMAESACAKKEEVTS